MLLLLFTAAANSTTAAVSAAVAAWLARVHEYTAILVPTAVLRTVTTVSSAVMPRPLYPPLNAYDTQTRCCPVRDIHTR
jgi:hypothetical protein